MEKSKLKIRIGQLSKKLDVEKFVIRFWEKEFKIRPNRSDGGQRYYTKEDLDKFILIKDLLYDQGLTIIGAKKYLKETNKAILAEEKFKAALRPTKTQEPNLTKLPEKFNEQITLLHKKLIRIRELL